MGKDNNVIFDTQEELFVKSTTDGLYIMPWLLLHDGYQVTRQETVVSVDPDAGIPITHSRFSAGGRIISAKIYVDTEETWWFWYARATNNRALPCWIYDVKLNGFMRCYILEQPTVEPAGNSVKAVYVQLKIYAFSNAIPIKRFITENTPERIVTEGNGALVYDNDEVMY